MAVLNARAAVFTLLLCQIAFSPRSLALRTVALFSKSGHRERTSRSGSELRRRNRILRGLFSSPLPLYSHSPPFANSSFPPPPPPPPPLSLAGLLLLFSLYLCLLLCLTPGIFIPPSSPFTLFIRLPLNH